MRDLVRETRVDVTKLVQPVFVHEAKDRVAIPSMPGIHREPLEAIARVGREVRASGVRALMLFGIPLGKDANGSGAHDDNGVVQRALRGLRAETDDLVLIADVCLCEYTDHAHCGLLDGRLVDNDLTLEVLARTAVSLARAGADVVAPSAMMDGQVAAIRSALDEAGFTKTAILAYAAKHASAFYAPFRQAADSAPRDGDRRSYQMDPANAREALREIAADVREGADLVLVKPGLPCLDIVHAAHERFDVPIGSFQVSGEYAQIKAAAQNGWIDEPRVVAETLTAFRRAGADFLLTYYATQARWILEEQP